MPDAAPSTEHVFDKAYGRVVEVTPDQKQQDPQRFEPVGAQRVRMVGPDGKPYDMPATSALEVATKPRSGWNWLDDKSARFNQQAEEFRQTHSNAFDVGSHEAVNQLLMGVPDIIGGHEESAEEQEGRRRAASENRVAQVIGGALGVGANIAATAGLGEAAQGGEALTQTAHAAGLADGAQATLRAAEAATPGLGQRMVAAAGRTAAEGALYASPQAAAQAAYGDYQQAAESLAWGIGTGGLLGLGHGAFSEAAGAIKAGAWKKLASVAEEHGLVGEGGKLDLTKLGIATPEQAAERQAAASAALEEHAKVLDKMIEDLPGKQRAALDAVAVKPDELAAKVGSTIADTRPGLAIPGFGGETKIAAADAVKKIAELGSAPMGFSDLQKLRSSLLSDAAGSVDRMRIARQIDQVIETEQNKAMQAAYHQLPLKADYASYLGDLAQKQQAFGQAAALGAPSMVQQWIANKAIGTVSKTVGGAIGGGAGGKVGAVLGGLVGGPVGAAAGASAGGWIGSKAVAPLVNRVLDHVLSGKMLELSGGALRKIANSDLAPYFGAALAKDASQAAASKVSTLGRALVQGVATNPPDAVKQYLGASANGLSKAQQWDKLSTALTNGASNPQQIAAEAAHISDVFDHDPRLAAQVAQNQLAVIHYLHDNLPKPPPPKPFDKTQWKPTAQDRAAFEARLEVAQNPWAAVEHATRGTLRAEHVDALRTLYPTIHDAMIAEVGKMAADPKAPHLSMGVKQQLSRLTGVSIDNPSGINHQAVYAPPPQGQQGPPPKKRGPKAGPKGSGGSPLTTSTQRLEFK